MGREEQQPVGGKDAVELAKHALALEVVEHAEHVELRDDELPRSIRQRAEIGEIPDLKIQIRVPAPAVLDHRRRDVDAQHVAPSRVQVTGDPPGTAPELEHPPTERLRVAEEQKTSGGRSERDA